MTRVLPLPAPARTSIGPSPAVTASRCGGFRSSRRCLSSGGTGRLYRAIGHLANTKPGDDVAGRPAVSSGLLDRDALGEVPGLVHVAAQPHRDVVREELQR